MAVGEVHRREVVGQELVGVAVGGAALVAVGERRLVAVVAVDDRERTAADDVDRDARRRVLADAPEPVRRAFLVGGLEDRRARRRTIGSKISLIRRDGSP